ncbi:MAG TPA: HAMP domain-containing sensor histidine kinase [Polyangiaceae bacterium]|nr:HAMP domain-containing sensor histidine kinase [Polyangiaceae bacterium]
MSAGDSVVLLEEGRVVRFFGDRVDRGDRRSQAPAPSNDIQIHPGPGIHPDDVRARLDDTFERKVREPASTLAEAAGLLTHHLSEAHAVQLRAIMDSAARIDAMLIDLLNFIRAENGGVKVSRRRIDLKVLCERVVDAISAAHPDRPMIFTSDRHVEGDWDPDGIERLLSKLVLNAIDHGAVRPPIRVGVRGLADAAVVEVWNAGAIADPAVRSRLFEPFVTGRGASNRKARGGLGLGLYTARGIALAHGGWIDLQSDENEGTTFQATLPRA